MPSAIVGEPSPPWPNAWRPRLASSRGRGGIGRRTRFRSWRGNSWGFESPRPHARCGVPPEGRSIALSWCGRNRAANPQWAARPARSGLSEGRVWADPDLPRRNGWPEGAVAALIRRGTSLRLFRPQLRI